MATSVSSFSAASLSKCKGDIVESAPSVLHLFKDKTFRCRRLSDTLLWAKLSGHYIMSVFYLSACLQHVSENLLQILHLVRWPKRMLHLVIQHLPFLSSMFKNSHISGCVLIYRYLSPSTVKHCKTCKTCLSNASSYSLISLY